MSWRDLLVVTRQSGPGSALHRARYPDRWEQTYDIELLRKIEHNLRIVAWMWADAKDAPPFPEPVELPWDPPAPGAPDAMDWDEGMAWLGWAA